MAVSIQKKNGHNQNENGSSGRYRDEWEFRIASFIRCQFLRIRPRYSALGVI